MSVFTAIVFLNMSFFLAEISALKIEKNKQLLENVAKLIAGSSAEEEKDAFAGADEDVSINDVFMSHHHHPHDLTEHMLQSSLRLRDHGIPLFGHRQIFSPPPES
jgi:ribonuclease BN (tRNA processing enzyme)